jgi:hypothetical protein
MSCPLDGERRSVVLTITVTSGNQARLQSFTHILTPTGNQHVSHRPQRRFQSALHPGVRPQDMLAREGDMAFWHDQMSVKGRMLPWHKPYEGAPAPAMGIPIPTRRAAHETLLRELWMDSTQVWPRCSNSQAAHSPAKPVPTMLAPAGKAVYDKAWWDYGRLSDRYPGATPILSMALIIGGRHARLVPVARGAALCICYRRFADVSAYHRRLRP